MLPSQTVLSTFAYPLAIPAHPLGSRLEGKHIYTQHWLQPVRRCGVDNGVEGLANVKKLGPAATAASFALAWS